MNFILDKSKIYRPNFFWTDFKGKEYYGTHDKLDKLMKMDKMNCRVTKIKKIQDGIYSR